ncbi:MAG: DNA-directed RNA polymerase subunit beta [Nitrospirae bacterium CG18_big_fil_WC_8_21_14_2_50_70_55]|nr:DNA-directed RNA polymerase subunit beta [Deltaproteobacteria bacterium]OIP63116.1 MAG: DNA-directed RNA polymerase subunit beta [Nitrospirae bacterium CG2_30_70_394]PIQ03768.1 MAG: DNA-directed RNA polymerase subunit beta [Nitrospirae bacterium CG18_big_fil_WC_8_21_14_2_50_70_55]PIU77680.1 MAG: DNA-directed RNA polymerase subunit beta [Nitrospirae bacterium CG06_land_8_20_14_3_00_70_43]PIW82852.1 MAG: DNA-directed RNA polymerase subunit beta [Nitrospirae bacterium CG_4_8_14_3_um_filter_70_8
MPTTERNQHRVRRDFSKILPVLEVEDLIHIQKSSYERFLQRDTPPAERLDRGLQAAFKSVFPITDFSESVTLEFLEYTLGEPKYDLRECVARGVEYASPIKLKVRMNLLEADPDTGVKRIKEVREQVVYMGEVPLMTASGTFVINGTERVVVSQLHRSPGAYFSSDKGSTHVSGKVIYAGRVIPYRGSWLDFEFDTKDVLYARIDRRRKMPATILLKALGYTSKEILRLYYDMEVVHLRPGGEIAKEINEKVLRGSRAATDIKAGRQMVVKQGNKITKVAIKRLAEAGVTELPMTREELVGRVVVDDVVDPTTGEVLVDHNTELREEQVEQIIAAGVTQIEFLFIDEITATPALRDTLLVDRLETREDAIAAVYKRLRPGELPNMKTARDFFEGLFFDPRRYDLSEVGRMKINEILGLDQPLSQRTLVREDIVEVVRRMVELRNGIGHVDDIDHLGNRRIRSVGELLENQLRVGLVRMEKAVREKMNLQELEELMPKDIINAKPVSASIKEFFGSSQLSQFMDQTNPLSEITHKRRLSALGPGGLTRERAGFEVRDVHPTHYGRICPIETPEGPNIGLITSLATYARVNEYGFIESPFRKVNNGVATRDVHYLSATVGERYHIAQANTPMDEAGRITAAMVSCRHEGEFVMVAPEQVEYMDVAPMQMVSVAAAMIPFLEHDDANRALMGSNMQRQAVPLLKPEAPLVGTGMEAVAARDSGSVVTARRDGTVIGVDAGRILVKATRKAELSALDPGLDIYPLVKYQRSNQNTSINQRPLVIKGDKVHAGQIIADGASTDHGELALGQNVTVAFMPWRGYNYEDAILLSERLVKEDRYTSVHIEEFTSEARDTKLGPEEITRDIPNVGDEALADLDEAGIVRIGALVGPGDVLVGKVTPKGETQRSPEEKLLIAIFGEKAGDVRDTSQRVPPGVEGIVVGVKIFSRQGVEKDVRAQEVEDDDVDAINEEYQIELDATTDQRDTAIRALYKGGTAGETIRDAAGNEIARAGEVLTLAMLNRVASQALETLPVNGVEERSARMDEILFQYERLVEKLENFYGDKIARIRRGDELPAGVIKQVKVYVAIKRQLSVGDKMAGRHGNKGVVSRILPEEDMPFLPDGTPVDIVLNPLGVPSRMNVGQILETHLGWAAKSLGMHVATPVFNGATEPEIRAMLKEAGLPESGQIELRDGLTGDPFDQPVTVGCMYILKLHHLVDDKIHARSIGPYSLVTQQPLGGKAQFGGQRLGEMEVWAMEAYGAAYTLQEFLTVKSDDVPGRTRMYESIVKGEYALVPGLPESFSVLVKELQSLCLDIELTPEAGAEAPVPSPTAFPI